jgi:glyoxylase-like metal-dependent hydrolase (beta-lactamase superfamily II)
MNLHEKELHYPWGDALPEPGKALSVAPGVLWLRMQLPFALDHINLWLLKDRVDGVEGWCVIDCCLDNPTARAQWQSVFDSVLMGLPILRVIVTHLHPDHLGLAHWLCARWKVPLYISATDYHTARTLIHAPEEEAGKQAQAFFRAQGMHDESVLQALTTRHFQFGHMVPAIPSQFVRLIDGLTLSIGDHDWHCISGQGHAPEHIALHCPSLGVLISGDMVLPRISSNISVFDTEPLADPLRLFLLSLNQFSDIPADCLVLPSHGKPFKGLHTRIAQLKAHHMARLEELREAMGEAGMNAVDAMALLFTRQLDPHQTTFALGEALAHLHYLWYAGEWQRQKDENGVFSFAPIEAVVHP